MSKSVVTAILIGVVSSAQGHHAAAPHFFLDQEISLEGVITDWKFVNPHSYIYLDVTDDEGATANWRCSLTTVARLQRRGWTADTLQPGQVVTLTGSPARREDRHCFYRSIVMVDGKVVTGEFPSRTPGDEDLEAQETVELQTPRPRYLVNGQPNLGGPWDNAADDFTPGALLALRGGMGMGMGPGSGLVGGGMPAPTEAGALAAAGYDPLYDHPAIACHPINIIFAWAADGAGNNIYQEEGTITLQYKFMDLIRTIHLDRSEHPDEITPSVSGHSIGRWEGDALIVHTVGFEQGVLFANNGTMHSDQMEVTERFEVSEDGQSITHSFVVHDPIFLRSDWVGEDVLQLTDEVQEPYECIDLGGANNQRPTDQG